MNRDYLPNRQVRIPRLMMILIGLLILVCNSARSAQPEQLHLKWSELPQVIKGQKLAMVLSDGIHVEGKVLDVKPDALVIKITRSSDRQAYPKGRASIPRGSTSVLHLKKVRYRWRVIGTAIGVGVGIIPGYFVALFLCPDEGPCGKKSAAALVGIPGGLATAGYFAGRDADQEVIVINIVP